MFQSNPMVLVFAVMAIIKLRKSLESAMLDVFLPVLLLVPDIYYLKIPHIPPISCADAVLIPIGVAAFILHFSDWRLQRTDLWVFGFAFAGFYTDYSNLDTATAIYNFPSTFLGGLLAYIVGRLIIEQTGNREKFAKRLVVLLAVVGVLSISEFVARHNLFVGVTNKFFGSAGYWGDQFRSGFVRVKGPFVGAEEAGIVFMIGLFLSLWLWFLNRSRKNLLEPRYLGLRKSTLCVDGILLGLVMTLSRGPLLAAAAGYLIARIGMVRRKSLALAVAVVLIAVGGVVASRRAAEYSSLDRGTTTNESKASATYRTQLYEVYKPIAEEGGLFGWSASGYQKTFAEHPKAASFFSIDNEYLLLWVIQGKIGLLLFILILAEGAIALVQALLRSQETVDTCFYFCLGGMLAGFLVVLITVFLAGQGYILFFLCSGWIQSLGLSQRSGPRFAFRRIFA